MAIKMPEGHGPEEWIVASNAPFRVILSSACVCGDRDCYFTAAVYSAVNTNLSEVDSVRLP